MTRVNRDEVRSEWSERSGEYSPEYYAYYGPNEVSERLRERIDDATGADPAILELGCSSGRHLAYLRGHGYEDLHGIEINEAAFDVMEEAYPDLAAEGTFRADAIENVVGDVPDDRFDVVYSVETLQHVHPDAADVFGELARIAGTLLVTVENEGDDPPPDKVEVNYVRDDVPLYYRNWKRVFTDLGLVEVDAAETERDTLRAFRADRG